MSMEMKLSILIMYPALESKDKNYYEMAFNETYSDIWKAEYRDNFGILSFNPGFSTQLVVWPLASCLIFQGHFPHIKWE